eukprot:NODE_8362_length_413_cov_34.153846_g7490_i0.p2 GENE.NODE_8362_length_413_cov_34.153846_g7490_i0~~NODE_8362_length_413_cov_34.153846_g7490_i0.p2  ORF type:complete len:68 (-),score=1.48 NODE_8362_length_413_cov_34.153846_g7490_i0:117-320(-)
MQSVTSSRKSSWNIMRHSQKSAQRSYGGKPESSRMTFCDGFRRHHRLKVHRQKHSISFRSSGSICKT